jgi:hypothetical protein
VDRQSTLVTEGRALKRAGGGSVERGQKTLLAPAQLQRETTNHTSPLTRFAGLRDEFQVPNVLTDRSAFGMSVKQSSKGLLLSLPLLSHHSESDVMCKHYPPQFTGRSQEFMVRDTAVTQLVGGHYIHSPSTQLVSNRHGHMNIHVEADGH